MMTMDERVEAGLAAYEKVLSETHIMGPDGRRNAIRETLAAAFPELHGDKPGWIAPWDLPEWLADRVASDGDGEDDPGWFLYDHKWGALRDAYLGKGDGG